MPANKVSLKSRIRGCLVGGAAGDALGYPVEFMSKKEIHSRFGYDGIVYYVPDPATGKALISDDTQMTLFTANGILLRETRGELRGIGADLYRYLVYSYRDWLWTQVFPYGKKPKNSSSWLLDIPQLYSQRAPGMTCLTALADRNPNESPDSFIRNPINRSRGCGAVMRVSPIGLVQRYLNDPAYEAAESAAITHGHPLGYISAAVLVQMIHNIVFETMGLKEALSCAIESTEKLFRDEAEFNNLRTILEKAVRLAANNEPDSVNIKAIGQGWVAEEAFSISVYCAIRHENNFSKAIIAAVNHDGDSDSTGAITGNILGAYLGIEAIEGKWKKDLELIDVILELADDLYTGCRVTDNHKCDRKWLDKYLYCTKSR